ncbi:hypothetical protein [Lentzea flava]|uniref:Uncharacterized protein n=1 Tax=Lentzea flava TaxID=103732 RepID=A0ABQ2UT09_9PSEU|nr:hypothetical protein [Lentzea flava]MCP2197282.1 hypothetical protein [Lentzea flava]GGU50224.1 hypothetical protein GCM10010178_48710 [Lentzea flava]
MTDPMELARAIADAVLYEGYLLYPYRASATKNQLRWQWGVLMPPSFTLGGEHPNSTAELLLVPSPLSTLTVRLRFLQLQQRVAEVGGRAVRSVTAGGRECTTWDEAVDREVDVVLLVSDLIGMDTCVPFTVDGGEDVEEVADDVRLVRRRQELSGVVTVRADPVPPGLLRLHVGVRNASSWEDTGADRPAALRHALIAAHTLLSVSEGQFLSLVDPPEWAASATAGCRNERTWPVLMGEPGRADTVLCAPIILYDHPAVAEESHGDLFDGTEIDELLTLRTLTLTQEEKRQVRATDARAAELLDRVEALPGESIEALHGTMRRTDRQGPDPTGTVVIAGVQVSKGSRVRLRPRRAADAQDMFLTGRTARVRAVMSDVDGVWHLAVTLEDDPAADLLAECGLYRYFGPEEVEPL